MIAKSSFMFSTVLLLISRSLSAEAINLSGEVRNQSDSPVIGAEVKLLSVSSISTTTDMNGLFELTGEITSVIRAEKSKHTIPTSFHGFNLNVSLRSSSPVTITVHNIAGKKL